MEQMGEWISEVVVDDQQWVANLGRAEGLHWWRQEGGLQHRPGRPSHLRFYQVNLQGDELYACNPTQELLLFTPQEKTPQALPLHWGALARQGRYLMGHDPQAQKLQWWDTLSRQQVFDYEYEDELVRIEASGRYHLLLSLDEEGSRVEIWEGLLDLTSEPTFLSALFTPLILSRACLRGEELYLLGTQESGAMGLEVLNWRAEELIFDYQAPTPQASFPPFFPERSAAWGLVEYQGAMAFALDEVVYRYENLQTKVLAELPFSVLGLFVWRECLYALGAQGECRQV